MPGTRGAAWPRSGPPSLDGLRAISISFVIIDHLSRAQGFPLRLDSDAADRQSEALGGFGLRVFFAITGYLITTLLLCELERRGAIHLTRFYFRRTLRIFVAYYTCVAAIVLLQRWGVTSVTPRECRARCHVHYELLRGALLGPGSWVVAIGRGVYAPWRHVCCYSAHGGGLWIEAAFLVLAPTTRVGYFYFFPDLVENEVRYRFDTVADALASGCRLAGRSDWFGRQPRYRRWLASRLFIAVPLVVVYVAMLDARLRGHLQLGITVQNVGIAAYIANYGSRIGRILN
jgi:peptidoglycan/LPS O-acetylase OafA/YrhL